jgi:hypothetical protein
VAVLIAKGVFNGSRHIDVLPLRSEFNGLGVRGTYMPEGAGGRCMQDLTRGSGPCEFALRESAFLSGCVLSRAVTAGK